MTTCQILFLQLVWGIVTSLEFWLFMLVAELAVIVLVLMRYIRKLETVIWFLLA